MARANSGALVKGFLFFMDQPGEARMVKKVSVDNTGAGAAGFLMLFDSATVPAESSVPDFEKAVAAAPSTTELDFQQQGERFAKGLYAVLSSTPAVLTTIASPLGWFQVTYQ